MSHSHSKDEAPDMPVVKFDFILSFLIIMAFVITIYGCRAPTEPPAPWLCPGTWRYEHELVGREFVLTDSTCIVSDSILTHDQRRNANVVSQARRFGADTLRMVRLSHRENYSGRPWLWSSTGCCTGIMQVNTVHLADFWELCAPTGSPEGTYGDSVQVLQEPRTNACYGVNIWLDKVRLCKGNLRCALRRYVGATKMAYVPRGYIAAVLE